ncbi:hypothetical protein FSP39_023536 [Pinctada imbricata]|uniref:Fibronectin type-III domain-containing protein n=1 Tax=Pinctada imbricata TaxID=66713 RepID=A0AA89C8M1_PINIB|nr:hypothetical protein FSP39_023536 [Pinctada imbricata]
MILKGEILSRGKNVMSMKLNSTATFELPESKTPVLYEILLEVKDVADNVRKTRRFALFDNSSNIELDQNSPLRATSASSQTKFIWQTNLKMVCFSWNGRYVNKLHVNGQFLTRIESDEDISKHYEQTTGLLPVNGTRNINGITSYNFTLHRNSAVVKEGVVHNFTSERVCINTKISDGDNVTFELTASDIVSHVTTESTYLLVDSTVPDLGEIYLERNGEKRLFVHSEKDLSTMKLHFEAFDVHSGMHEIQWSLRASENNVLLGMGAISIIRLSKNVTCSSSFCYCPKQGPCELSNHTIDLNLLVVNNTHIGNHNRRYIFSLMLTNNALLRDIEHIDILVDDSAPEKGTVTEGAKGSPDVDYTEENSTIIHWHGFIDHESGIMKYLVAIGPECLPKNELISKNISDEYHLLQTSSNEARLPLKTIGKNFVSVVAFNNALEPSDVACSDGITFDRSIPKVYNLNISLAKTDSNVGCLHEEPWMVTANLKRIRLPSNSSECASICKGKDDTDYVALLPILVKPFQEDKASFLCRYLPMNNDTVIYIPDDTIHVEWSILKSMSQISEVYIGFGSLRSQHLNPDLLSFQKAIHPGKYTKHHTGFSNGEIIYLYLKTQSKTGVASTSVVGPLLIDETPPICPSSLPVQVANDAVSVNWNSSTFTDKEQMEQIDEILFSVVSERGHKTPIHEWRLHDSRKLCINEHEECINYPIVKLQSMDSQAGLSFFFHFQVFNKAGHSCVFNSESFKLPSIFDPGHAKVIDIFHNESSGAESTDTDVIFDSSKFCIQYSGLREHENVTLSLGLGSDKLLDDVLPFRLLNSSKPARTICIRLNDTTLRRNTKYYATLKAECTGGLTLSSSDGFYVMDDEFLKASISLYNGHSCFDDLRSSHISAHSDTKGVLTFADNLSVGHLYTLVSSGDILNITSNDVLIQSTTNNKAEFVPMKENPHIVINKNISLAELYACVQDETIFISSTEVSFSWVVDASVSKFVSHYEVGVQRKKQNETYDDIFEFIIKNTTFFKLRKRLNSGSYRGYIAPCFGPICGPQIFAESFTFTSTKPRAGDMKCNVTFYSLDNIEVSGQFDTFNCSFVDDSILFYRYGLFKDSLGTSLVGEKRIAPSSIGKTLKFNYTFEGDVSPRQTLYFCTEGFCRSTLSTTSCVQTLHDVKFNQFDKTHVFEFDKRGRSEFQKASSRLTSTKLFEKLTLMENLDVDFVRSDSTVTGLVFPDTVGRRTWFLMTQRRVPAIDCTDDDACIQSKLVPDPVVSFPLNTGYSGILYLCLDESLSIGSDNSTLEPPSTSSCSNGFKIDDEKPVSGTVTISSDDGFLTSSSEMIVGWEGFKDQDPPSTDGPLRKQIAFYEIAIGTQPEKQDVLPYTSVGLGTKINIEDISLRTGLAYYATVKAYDKAGNMAKAFSPGVIVDETPPSTETINVGSSFWHRKVIGGNTVEVHWEGFEDSESGIAKFEIAVGTKPHIDDVVSYTDIIGKASAVLAMNRSTTGEQNFVTLIVTNRAGLFTVAYSEAFVFDHTPPRPGVVRDGSIKDNHDKDFQYQSTSISAHWTLFSDFESGISYYRVGLGFTPEKADVYSLHYVGNQTSWTWHGSFIHGAKYYALVEACNGALLCTKIASNGILIDDSPPIPGLVRIGNLDHTTRYIPKRTSVSAKWIGFEDPQSGIREFHVCIGSNETTCDVMSLRNALLSDSYIATGLNLPTMTPLFFTVRAINHLEMPTISSSDRFFVDDTSPILIRAPRFTNCVNENEVHYQIDASRLCIKWNITDEESSIISQTLKYRTHDDGHVPVEHLVLGNFQTFQLILNPTDWLFSGDTYTASIQLATLQVFALLPKVDV